MTWQLGFFLRWGVFYSFDSGSATYLVVFAASVNLLASHRGCAPLLHGDGLLFIRRKIYDREIRNRDRGIQRHRSVGGERIGWTWVRSGDFLRRGPIKAAAAELRARGARIVAIQEDLAIRDGVERLWKEVQSSGRDLDVACINAGVGVGGLFGETDLDAELNMVNLNCAGTVQLAKYVVQHMVPRQQGGILFTASIAGEMVAAREAVYAATKAFVLSLTLSVRYELRDSGVSVTALQPGPTETDFFHRAGMDNTEVGSEGKSESQPDDVARQGIDALFAGKDQVYSASVKTKTEGMLANVIPDNVKAANARKDGQTQRKLEKEEAFLGR